MTDGRDLDAGVLSEKADEVAVDTEAPYEPPEPAERPTSWRRYLLFASIFVVTVVAVAALGLFARHTLAERSCENQANAAFVALGNGLSTPAPSTSGMDASDVRLVQTARASYRREYDSIDPTQPAAAAAQRREALARQWTSLRTALKATVMDEHGCGPVPPSPN